MTDTMRHIVFIGLSSAIIFSTFNYLLTFAGIESHSFARGFSLWFMFMGGYWLGEG